MVVFKSLDIPPKIIELVPLFPPSFKDLRGFPLYAELAVPIAQGWMLRSSFWYKKKGTSPFFSLFHDFKTPRCQVPALPFWLLLVSPGDLCSCWCCFQAPKLGNTPQNDVADESWTKKLLRHHRIALGLPREPRHDLFVISLTSGAGFWGYLELHRDKGQPPLWILEYHEKMLGSYHHRGTPVPALTSPPAACWEPQQRAGAAEGCLATTQRREFGA